MSGRKRDNIWIFYNEKKSDSSKFLRAICKKCGSEMQGLVARMKKHIEKCGETGETIQNKDEIEILNQDAQNQQPSTSTSQQPIVYKHIAKKTKLDDFVIKTSGEEKQKLDLQVARYLYATNTPFRHVENQEFVKLVTMLRPGYKAPTREDIGGPLLDFVYEQEKMKCKNLLEGQTVSLSIDGWSNIRNEPIVCACVTTKDGHTVLTDTIDTSGNRHTAEYLKDVTSKCIKEVESTYECKVGSVVSDNAANMSKMRQQLQNQDNENDDNTDVVPNIITYGCSAHILNLLAKDFDIPEASSHVIQIIKYFRNNHFARAVYTESKGTSLIMPMEVRWNTMCQSIESYLKNWPKLMEVVDKYHEIDDNIRIKVQNIGIKRTAESLLDKLKPIANALDKTQSDKCFLSDCVLVWKKLLQQYDETDVLNLAEHQMVMKRYQQVMTPAHFLAYLLNPKMPQDQLSQEEKDLALEFVNIHYRNLKNTNLLQIIIKLHAKASPFNTLLLSEEILKTTDIIDWWTAIHNLKGCVTQVELEIMKQLHTAISSSAGVERIFSAFNLVHSKLRNKLGTQKSAKLVFLLKCFNC